MSAKAHTIEPATTTTWPAGSTLSQPSQLSPSASAQTVGSMALFMPGRRDYLNIGLILAAVIGVLLLVSPARSFVITDDWCYAQSVDAMLKGAYIPHEYSMATAVGHVGWGAIVQSLLGTGFTTLSFATLIMGAAGLVFFYLLLRHLAIPAPWAMLGVTVLGGSPMFIYLSYSFMTDITFLTYTLASLLCYVRAAQHAQVGQRVPTLPHMQRLAVRVDLRVDTWLMAGSIFASLAYLTRQLGLFLPIAVLAYFWWSRSGLTWRRAIALGVFPAIAAAAFTLWQHTFPPSVASYVETLVRANNFSNLDWFLLDRALRIVVSLFLVGIMLVPLIRLKRKDIWAIPLFAALVLYQLATLRQQGTMLPKNLGNIMDHTGLLMQDFENVPILPEWFWSAADIMSLAAVSLFAYNGIRYLLNWLRTTIARYRGRDTAGTQQIIGRTRSAGSRREGDAAQRPGSQPITARIKRAIEMRPAMDPAWVVYGFGIAVLVPTAILSYFLMDRYWLPVLPAVLLLALRYNTRHTGQGPSSWRWVVALPVVAFAVVSQQDYMVSAQVRWDGAQSLVQQNVARNQIQLGIEWAGWYLAEEGADYFQRTGSVGDALNPTYAVTDPVYLVSGIPYRGYEQIGMVEYRSWLRERGEILLLKRQGR